MPRTLYPVGVRPKPTPDFNPETVTDVKAILEICGGSVLGAG